MIPRRTYRSPEEEDEAVTAAGLCAAGMVVLVILGAVVYILWQLWALIVGVIG